MSAASERGERFGRLLKIWRVRSSWSQFMLHQGCRALGFDGPGAGTVSSLELGQFQAPGMQLFAAFAALNAAIAAGKLPPMQRRDIRQRLLEGAVITDAEGCPWDLEAFARAYHLPHQVSGELWELSGSGTPMPELTTELVEGVNQQLAAGFLEASRGIQPRYEALRQAAAAAPPDQRPLFEGALLGEGYNAEGLAPLWDAGAGEWLPLQWLHKWRESRKR